MNLGIDLGTTRTIVAYADRGNYPVVGLFDRLGDSVDHYPSVVTIDDGELRFGFDALAAAEAGAPLTRSFKRALAAPGVTERTTISVAGVDVLLLDVLSGFLESLLHELRTSSTVAGDLGSSPSAVVAVPAHAHTAQRMLTLEAFRRAGFDVRAIVNEPSAAGFEYTHRQARTLSSRRTKVIVYDLGGGTFDASLVKVNDKRHEVEASLGLDDVGGDDFDAVLAGLAIERAGGAPAAADLPDLLDQCREAKERLTPQTKRIALEVGDVPVVVPVGDFYDAAVPLVERTIEAMAPIAGTDESELGSVAGIYLVGGASGLPLVPRLLRERFGRRVHRSPYPAASTAIGLAIAGDEAAGFSLTDRLSRGFGVFRERESGSLVDFDALLTPGTPHRGEVQRRYQAAHNVGWFRFVEFSRMDPDGHPRGDLIPFAEVVVPFDPALDLDAAREVPVVRRDGGPSIEETYTVDDNGMIDVRIRNMDSGDVVEVTLSTTRTEVGSG